LNVINNVLGNNMTSKATAAPQQCIPMLVAGASLSLAYQAYDRYENRLIDPMAQLVLATSSSSQLVPMHRSLQTVYEHR
jgi:hypothetical protein